MANILILTNVVPYPPHRSGNTLRVYHLSRELVQHHDCFLAAFADPDHKYRELEETGLYKSTILLPERPGPRPRIIRSLDFTTAYLDKVARPGYFERVVGLLKEFVKDNRVDLIITHTLGITQYAEYIPGVAHIIDLIDCYSLATERRYHEIKSSLDFLQRCRHLARIYRCRHRERHLTRHFPCITTVSPIDKACFVSLNEAANAKIHVVPNGVSPPLLDYRFKDEEIANAIAFSGTLDFPPNSTAVYYFYERVFLPYLRNKGITWYIVGRNPEERMMRLAREHDDIVVTGEVQDIFGLIARMPIVINPMRIGGGLKNKVLEGLALRRLVISNKLGIESISAVRDVHYVHAERPEEFAAEIIKYLGDKEGRERIGRAGRRLILDNYTWSRVATSYQDLISQALAARSPSV